MAINAETRTIRIEATPHFTSETKKVDGREETRAHGIVPVWIVEGHRQRRVQLTAQQTHDKEPGLGGKAPYEFHVDDITAERPNGDRRPGVTLKLTVPSEHSSPRRAMRAGLQALRSGAPMEPIPAHAAAVAAPARRGR